MHMTVPLVGTAARPMREVALPHPSVQMPGRPGPPYPHQGTGRLPVTVHPSHSERASPSAATAEPPEALPATFRRLVARRTGASFREVAELEEAQMLDPGEGEVLVRVSYAGVNGGCETFRARGEHAFARNASLPVFMLGAEGAGTVVKIGPGVGGLVPGQQVTFVGGAFSEFVLARAALCWPVPVASPAAVALTISGTVAAAALRKTAGLQAGEVVLVTAAAGATGSFAVQLAALWGGRVVATCGGERKAARLRSLPGVERVIDHTKEDVAGVLRREYGGAIDVAYEGVGGPLQRAAYENLAEGGRLLVVGYISGYPHAQQGDSRAAGDQGATSSHLPPLPASSELFWGAQKVHGPGGRTVYGNVWPSERQQTLEAKREVFDLHAAGRLQAWVDDGAVFSGVGHVCDAVDYMLSGQAVGKVVVGI